MPAHLPRRRPAALLRALGLVCAAAALGTTLAAPLPVQAQNLFAPRVLVDDQPITEFEVQQRAAFLTLLNVGGSEAEAIERLIEERLQRAEAVRLGVRVDDAAVQAGMAEFAGRYQMTTEVFLERLGEAGVDPLTFRDFVEIGLMWREVVRIRFAGRIVVNEADIDRALSTDAIRATARVQISELVLPTDPRFAEAVAEVAPRIAAITSTEEFALAARQISIAPSREAGGRVPDWLPISNFPENLARQFLDATPGQVLGPIDLPGGQAIAFLQLRARDTVRDIPPARVGLRYLRFTVPGGRSEAALAEVARIRAAADTCADVPPIAARGAGNSAVEVVEQLLPEVPQAVAVELARLDTNEISSVLLEGDRLLVLMLCSRELQFDEPPSRAQVRERLINERAAGMTGALLAELRGNARIVYR